MSKEYKILSEIAPTIPGAPSANTVWTWCRAGLKSRNGERVRLGHIRVGKRMMTSQEDVEIFLKALNDSDMAYFEQQQMKVDEVKEAPKKSSLYSPRPRSESERQKAAVLAHKRLAAKGM